ncbi:MAG TPA: S41 family peptidase [Steroidobacteraceae bacterium]|jgi:carboxyl-terminal processing protease
MSPRARLGLALLVGLMLGLSLSVASRVAAEHTPSDTAAAPAAAVDVLPWKDARLMAEVMRQVHQNYVDPVDDHELMQNAIRGMVESLDEHSTFLTPDEFDDMKVSTSGAYAGIGVEVVPGNGGVSVVRRMAGSPAQRAGIKDGDIIVRIDGVAVDASDLDAAIERMRGPEGSSLHLAVRREGNEALLEFQVRRAHVKLSSVSAELLSSDYGYLRISSFTDTTATEVEQAVASLQRLRGDKLQGFVIDLRNDPGGVLDAAIQIADDFLDHGTIVSAEGRTDDARFRIEAKPGDITHGARLVVLVNGGSASASEILAAALHDNHRATLVGRRTYGKGSVQTIMPLPDGQALKITTSRYFTPAGISINGVGIVPDTVLDGPEQPPGDLDAATTRPTLADRDPQVAAALHDLSLRTGLVAGR